jgi:hypothetical protein
MGIRKLLRGEYTTSPQTHSGAAPAPRSRQAEKNQSGPQGILPRSKNPLERLYSQFKKFEKPGQNQPNSTAFVAGEITTDSPGLATQAHQENLPPRIGVNELRPATESEYSQNRLLVELNKIPLKERLIHTDFIALRDSAKEKSFIDLIGDLDAWKNSPKNTRDDDTYKVYLQAVLPVILEKAQETDHESSNHAGDHVNGILIRKSIRSGIDIKYILDEVKKASSPNENGIPSGKNKRRKSPTSVIPQPHESSEEQITPAQAREKMHALVSKKFESEASELEPLMKRFLGDSSKIAQKHHDNNFLTAKSQKYKPSSGIKKITPAKPENNKAASPVKTPRTKPVRPQDMSYADLLTHVTALPPSEQKIWAPKVIQRYSQTVTPAQFRAYAAKVQNPENKKQYEPYLRMQSLMASKTTEQIQGHYERSVPKVKKYLFPILAERLALESTPIQLKARVDELKAMKLKGRDVYAPYMRAQEEAQNMGSDQLYAKFEATPTEQRSVFVPVVVARLAQSADHEQLNFLSQSLGHGAFKTSFRPYTDPDFYLKKLTPEQYQKHVEGLPAQHQTKFQAAALVQKQEMHKKQEEFLTSVTEDFSAGHQLLSSIEKKLTASPSEENTSSDEKTELLETAKGYTAAMTQKIRAHTAEFRAQKTKNPSHFENYAQDHQQNMMDMRFALNALSESDGSKKIQTSVDDLARAVQEFTEVATQKVS